MFIIFLFLSLLFYRLTRHDRLLCRFWGSKSLVFLLPRRIFHNPSSPRILFFIVLVLLLLLWISNQVRSYGCIDSLCCMTPIHGIALATVASNLDIKKPEQTAPTPQNTPINPAPITSTYRPNISSIAEDNMESNNTTTGEWVWFNSSSVWESGICWLKL